MATRFTFVPLAALVAAALLTSAGARAEQTHVVAKGQTLVAIAKRYHVSVDALREANDLAPGALLHPGMELVVPTPARSHAAHAATTVKPESARAAKSTADYARRPRRPGVVHLVRGADRLDVQMTGRHGRLNASALAGLARMLRFGPTGAEKAIDPRLAALVTAVSDHFGGRPIHVVSGFRPYSPRQYTPHSNHNTGHAIDFFVEGVPNTVLRDYCRQFRDAGVGYYPNSSFVHLDVRAGKAFWIDRSHAGEAPQYDSAAGHRDADEAARDVEAEPMPPGMDDHTSYVDGGSKPTP
ncbi:MAG TPA: DUF882 domain-containing protein [Minicystis sp.]|nr:DUF882 domain-containing protein [Minicystis sp.]